MKRLSRSRYFLILADSILTDLDRETLSELMADYFYFKSKGMSNADYALFEATRARVIKISFSAISVLVQGFLLDKEFRSLLIGAVSRSLK
jgi:hypothetical protein